MKTPYAPVGAAAVLLALSLGSASAGDNFLGLQFGADVGTSHLNVDQLPPAPELHVTNDSRSWDAFLGLRPLHFLGGEVQYFHLGPVNESVGSGEEIDWHASQKGEAAFVVGYLPLPVPLLDIYGKAGVARTTSSLNTVYIDTHDLNTPPGGVVASYSQSHDDTGFAWGLGASYKLPWTGLAVRAEMERLTAGGGHPTLATVGISFTP
jgi:opacity protein-like surface antigen